MDTINFLPNLTNTSCPGVVKPMRKSLLLARNGLDVFVFAYPGAENMRIGKPPKNGDVFTALRDDLDEGYTLVGDFQDLQNVNYTHEDYLERFNACLAWKVTFLVNIDKYGYKAYVLSASTTKLFKRKKGELSKDYWGNVTGRPNLTISGYQNVAILADGQLNNSVNIYTYITNLTDIWDDVYHTQFHDYRKLLRAINFVGTAYSVIYKVDVGDQMDLVNKAYGKFGDLNDLCTEYSYYVSKGNQQKADAIKAQIITNWAALIQFLAGKNFKAQMGSLQLLLIPH